MTDEFIYFGGNENKSREWLYKIETAAGDRFQAMARQRGFLEWMLQMWFRAAEPVESLDHALDLVHIDRWLEELKEVKEEFKPKKVWRLT